MVPLVGGQYKTFSGFQTITCILVYGSMLHVQYLRYIISSQKLAKFLIFWPYSCFFNIEVMNSFYMLNLTRH